MGRKKGWVMTEEHKKALAEGRRKAQADRAAGVKRLKTIKGIIFRLTGREKDAFDFFPVIRKAYRRVGDYVSSNKVIHEITRSPYWNNPTWIQDLLATKGTVST